MKKSILLSFILFFTSLSDLKADINSDFFLHENGVTIMCTTASVGDSEEVNGVTYTKQNRDQIETLIGNGDFAELETTCTSGITDMSSLFSVVSDFNHDISHWDVSSVTNMNSTFFRAGNFNGGLSHWDVSNVTDMQLMFFVANNFNSDISDWDVSSVTDMSRMFESSGFNNDISSWNTSNVVNMQGMFRNASDFNQDINSWDVSSVETMAGMFQGADSFDQDISSWNVSKVADMTSMFSSARSFNQDISSWNVSQVTNMRRMFYGALVFNQSLNGWDVSSVGDMRSMFRAASEFNSDISMWNVSSVENMSEMFMDANTFNQDINTREVTHEGKTYTAWNVSTVKGMSSMFLRNNNFNQDIGEWDVSNVSTFSSMFLNAESFNQDLSSWNPERAQSFFRMFNGAEQFSSNLGAWNISQVTDIRDMLRVSGLSVQHYDQTLSGWANFDDTPMGLSLGAEGLIYCTAVDARNVLIDEYNWEITGDMECNGSFDDGDGPELLTFIHGANQLVGGRSTTVNITYVNRGNVDIYDAMLFISWPEEIEVEELGNEFVSPDFEEFANILGVDFDPDEFDNQIKIGGGGMVMPFWLYYVPANSSATISLRVRIPEGGSTGESISERYGRGIEANIGAVSLASSEFTRTGDLMLADPAMLYGYWNQTIELVRNTESHSRVASVQADPHKSVIHSNRRAQKNFLDRCSVAPSNVLNTGDPPSSDDVNNYVGSWMDQIIDRIPGSRPSLPSPIAKSAQFICKSFGRNCNNSVSNAQAARGAYSDATFDYEGECNPPTHEPPPYNPRWDDGSSASSRSFGHPHFMSFDRMDFDFQAVGEFILTRSKIDETEVQIRLEQFDPGFEDFTIITAVGLNVTGDEVLFEENRESPSNVPDLFVNGTETDLPEFGEESVSLPNGGFISRAGRALMVEWPDGESRVDVRQSNTIMGMMVEPMLSYRYNDNLKGLLGTADGNRDTDFTTRDGTVLIPPLSFDELYRDFGDSWRISNEESLFGVPTFEDLNIPTQHITTSDLDPAAVANAEEVCADYRIENPILMDNCVFDVAITGDERFARDTIELITPTAEDQVDEWMDDTDSKIQVILDAAPAGEREFTFSGSGDIGEFSLTEDGINSNRTHTVAFPYLSSGTFEITQHLQDEEDSQLTEISCTAEQGIITDLSEGLVTIDLSEGDVVRCTFRNIGRPYLSFLMNR